MTDTGTFPWPSGAATGIGSLPGQDIAEAQRVILGELSDLPHLPELPDRGPGADLIGRGAALLVDLPVELYAAHWRVAGRPGRDLRVALDFLERDLDAMTEQAAEFTGTFKVQAAGPWTLAASLDLPTGGAVLRDPGATRDLAASLTEGLRAHIAEVRARLPHATVVLQIDEPSLPSVLAGRVLTESGFGTLRAIEPTAVHAALTALVTAVGVPVIAHSCAPDPPIALFRAAGATAIAVDLALVGDLDALGEAIDAGVGLFAGAADTRALTAAHPPSSTAMASRVLDAWRKLGFPVAQVAGQVVITPACGLAGAGSVERVRPLLAACRDAGKRLRDTAEA